MVSSLNLKPEANPVLTGDYFLLERASGNYKVLFNTLSGQIGGGGTTIVTGNSVRFAIGSYNFLSGQNDSTFINFGGDFLISPNIIGNLANNSGEPILAFQLSGISSSGFYVNLTDTVTGNNYNFNYMAITGNGFLGLGGGFLSTTPSTIDVINKTDNYTILSSQSRSIFTNQFSRKQGLQLTLPTATTGLNYQFVIHSISGMSIVPANTNKIFVADNNTTANGFIYSSGLGATMNLVAINSGEWFAHSFIGGWGIV